MLLLLEQAGCQHIPANLGLPACCLLSLLKWQLLAGRAEVPQGHRLGLVPEAGSCWSVVVRSSAAGHLMPCLLPAFGKMSVGSLAHAGPSGWLMASAISALPSASQKKNLLKG